MRLALVTLLTATALAGCSSNPFTGETQISNTAIGAGGGAALGAGAGLLTGSLTNQDPKQAALIGAGVGAAAGAVGGLLLDARDTGIRQELQAAGVSVTQTGKQVQLNMNRAVRFQPGTGKLTKESPAVLNAVARVLKQYPQSSASIAAYAEAAGDPALAAVRAKAIADYLEGQGIIRQRLNAENYGGDNQVRITLSNAA